MGELGAIGDYLEEMSEPEAAVAVRQLDTGEKDFEGLSGALRVLSASGRPEMGDVVRSEWIGRAKDPSGWDSINVAVLAGETLSAVRNVDDEEIVFEVDGVPKYRMYHDQSCCESVTVEDIVGDLDDLVGSPILMAEEVTHDGANPEGVTAPEYQDSFTWTFYKFATMKGYVTIRWYGSSNGYYSETVTFRRVGGDGQ